MLFNRAVMEEIVPFMPPTVSVDGYGVAMPMSGIVMGAVLVTLSVSDAIELTVNTNVSLAVNAPSLTVTLIVAEPVCAAIGVTVTVLLAPLPPKTMFALGTRAGFEELPITVKLPTGVSVSPTVNGIAAVEEF